MTRHAARALVINTSNEMNVDQAAKFCGISKKTLYTRLADGQGPRCLQRFGRLWFTPEDLDAWVRSQTKVRKALGR